MAEAMRLKRKDDFIQLGLTVDKQGIGVIDKATGKQVGNATHVATAFPLDGASSFTVTCYLTDEDARILVGMQHPEPSTDIVEDIIEEPELVKGDKP